MNEPLNNMKPARKRRKLCATVSSKPLKGNTFSEDSVLDQCINHRVRSGIKIDRKIKTTDDDTTDTCPFFGVTSRHIWEGTVSILDVQLDEDQCNVIFDTFMDHQASYIDMDLSVPLDDDAGWHLMVYDRYNFRQESFNDVLMKYLQPIHFDDAVGLARLTPMLANAGFCENTGYDNGDTATRKVCCWNVNGLGNITKKGFLKKLLLEHDPDILLLSEIKIGIRRLFRLVPYMPY